MNKLQTKLSIQSYFIDGNQELFQLSVGPDAFVIKNEIEKSAEFAMTRNGNDRDRIDPKF